MPRQRLPTLPRRLLTLVLACAAIPAAGAADAGCATSVAQLRALLADPAFPLQWEETGMSDARPLLVTLEDRQAGLFISFVKTGEGLLAEGPAQVCPRADRLEARLRPEGLQLGAAASPMLKVALRSGVGVGLQRTAPGRLRIGTLGWSGDFVPGSAGVGLRTSFGSF
jgi:hypothetical protein